MADSAKNLSLWERVEKTDPKHTKKAKLGQMEITAISPQYQRKNATAVFGPYGIGWGVKDEHWSFLDFDNGTKLAKYRATLWYKLDGESGEFPITSNVKVCYVTKNGSGYLMVDDEYAKKGQTDALTKGLSMLGFNSDVFMGLYDDNKYVNKMREEFAPPPVTKESVLASLKQAGSMAKLKAAWGETPDELKKDPEVVAAKDEAKDIISNNE